MRDSFKTNNKDSKTTTRKQIELLHYFKCRAMINVHFYGANVAMWQAHILFLELWLLSGAHRLRPTRESESRRFMKDRPVSLFDLCIRINPNANEFLSIRDGFFFTQNPIYYCGLMEIDSKEKGKRNF